LSKQSKYRHLKNKNTSKNSRKQKTERHKLKSILGYVSKNGYEWDSNPCRNQPVTACRMI